MARGHDRHGPPRRRPPRGRHLLRLQRLHAPVGPPRRAVRCARHLLVDARLGRPGPGRPHPSTRRAPGRRCGPCPACGSSVPPTPTRRRMPGASRWTPTGPPRLVLTRQNVPVLEGTAEASDGVARGGYVLVDPRRRRRPTSCSSARAPRCAVCVAAAGRPRLGAPIRCGPGSCRCRRGTSSPLQTESYRAEVLPPGVPTPGRRGGGLVRLGALRRRRRRHRPLRRVGPRRGRARALRVHPRQRGGPGPGAAGPSPARSTALTPIAQPGARPPSGVRTRREGSTMTKLHDLYEQQGQSPWLDNLRRDYLRGGRLAELVAQGIRGVTSNPTIFAKAIESGNDYDEQFGQLLATHTVEEAYWELVVTDIRDALAVLRPCPRQLRRRRRLRVVGGGAGPGARHRGDHRGGPPFPRARGRAQPVREDPGHRRRRARHPGHVRRGPEHQHHVAVQPGALRRRDRGLHRRSRGPRSPPGPPTSPPCAAWRRSS